MTAIKLTSLWMPGLLNAQGLALMGQLAAADTDGIVSVSISFSAIPPNMMETVRWLRREGETLEWLQDIRRPFLPTALWRAVSIDLLAEASAKLEYDISIDRLCFTVGHHGAFLWVDGWEDWMDAARDEVRAQAVATTSLVVLLPHRPTHHSLLATRENLPRTASLVQAIWPSNRAWVLDEPVFLSP